MNIAKQPDGADTPRLKSIKRQLFHLRRLGVQTAKRIHADVLAGGKAQLEAELEGDAAELEAAHAALKTFLLALDPSAEVPDLE
jgi:hypothetical protein